MSVWSLSEPHSSGAIQRPIVYVAVLRAIDKNLQSQSKYEAIDELQDAEFKKEAEADGIAVGLPPKIRNLAYKHLIYQIKSFKCPPI